MIFYDSETHPIRPGRQAPPVVCSQWAYPGHAPIIRTGAVAKHGLADALDSDATIAGHNAAFDMAAAGATWPDLLPLIFDAYADDRITCMMLRERLIAIAKGRPFWKLDLRSCLDRYKIEHTVSKEDPWRLRYAELEGVPVEAWPAEAVRYAMDDVRYGHALYAAQEGNPLDDQYRQARAGFWLYLTSCWGLQTDPRAVHEFSRLIEEEAADLKRHLVGEGLVRPNGVKDKKAAQERIRQAYAPAPPPLTKPSKTFPRGQVSTSADTCEQSNDPTLVKFARYTSMASLRGRAKRLLAAHPLPIQTRYTVILETGRTSSSKGKEGLTFGDQVQNMDRAPGPRECYVPREGCVFISVDWSGAELHALAQACIDFGLHSTLADKLNAGLDVHLWFACQMNGWSYDAVDKKDPKVKAARQFAKIGNFGLPGGLGARTLVTWARKSYGVELDESRAKWLKRQWLNAFPEMTGYFRRISNEDLTERPVVLERSGRVRAAPTYCSRANNYFQGPASDMLKSSGFRISRECYVGAMRPARIVNEIHDEIIVETPERYGHDHAMRMSEIMEDEGRVWFPDCPPKVEPAIMRRWRKSAGPVWVDGRLTPYEDRVTPFVPLTIRGGWEKGVEA